jgi:hypothetical protein
MERSQSTACDREDSCKILSEEAGEFDLTMPFQLEECAIIDYQQICITCIKSHTPASSPIL